MLPGNHVNNGGKTHVYIDAAVLDKQFDGCRVVALDGVSAGDGDWLESLSM